MKINEDTSHTFPLRQSEILLGNIAQEAILQGNIAQAAVALCMLFVHQELIHLTT